MRLSEAILLGDLLKRADPNIWLSPDGSCGCALGGALLAAGTDPWKFGVEYGIRQPRSYQEISEMRAVKSRWPWLTGDHLMTISDLYRDAAHGYKTIEQVADYVRSIEPPEIELTETVKPENEAVAV